MEEQLSHLLLFIIPALITGAIAVYFFREHVNNESNRRNFIMHKNFQKEVLPIRLQAYERMTLFLERIALSKLLVRVKPLSADKNEYESLLISNIEQEFEHNLAQQIYVSEECWLVINTTKNATIQLIRKSSMNKKCDSAEKLQEIVLTELMEAQSPSNTAISFIRKEVSELWGDY